MKRKKKEKKRDNLPKKVLRCPQCGGTNIVYESGLITGYKYLCKDCSYMGALIIEEDVKIPE
jgi:transposase-like protein